MSAGGLKLAATLPSEQRLAYPLFTINELITIAPSVAKKVAIDVVIETITNAPQRTVAFARNRVAPQSTMHTYRRCGLQIPFARVMLLQRLVCEYPRWANFHQVAAEFILQSAILMPAEIDVIVRGKYIEVASARIVTIKTDAAITLDATIHLVLDERTEILICERAFRETEFTICVTSHHSHVLQMTFTAFVTHGAIVRMVHHQPLNYTSAKLLRVWVTYGYTRAFSNWRHARHHDLTVRVVLVLKLLDRALPTSPH